MAANADKNRRKGGRPRKSRDELRCHHVKAGFTDLEFDTVEYKAKQAGERVSDYIRAASLNAKVKARINEEQLELMRDIARMGNNLNQLARRANAGGFESVARQCTQFMVGLSILLDRISRGGNLAD